MFKVYGHAYLSRDARKLVVPPKKKEKKKEPLRKTVEVKRLRLSRPSSMPKAIQTSTLT